MTRQDFLEAAVSAARDSSRGSGLPPGVTVAQAALESAWGASQLSREANNYFGIKAHGGHDYIELPTTEVTRGVVVRTGARFARYSCMAECFADRDRLILTLACYADALSCAADPEEFVRAIAKHWATDPKYPDKLLNVYRSNGFFELDEPTTHK